MSERELSTRVLSRPVLVLNKGYCAYAVTTVEEAIISIFAGRAEAVNHTDECSYDSYSWADWAKIRPTDDDGVVRTASDTFIAPQVIRMVDYATVPRRGVTCNRLNLMRRDGQKCQYCGKRVTGETMTLDHVIPRAQGGESRWENLVVSCYDCNQRKAGRTPKQANMVLLKKPVKPDYSPEFVQHARKFKSWQKFLDFAYFNVPLKD